MGRWVVAMSGGVDSSVAAALLAAQGHEVVGVTLNLWPAWLPEPDDAFRACCGVAAVEDARAVARRLGIRHYVLNMREEFEREVIARFADEYARGRTPNPCIACNQAIKFSLLLARAEALGMDGVATGHYARVDRDPSTGRYVLRRGRDPRKDQSYVLYGLTQAQLARVRFPLGEMTKEQTRSLARQFGLPVADKPDSQEICFVPRGSYAEVVGRLRPQALHPGPIVDTSGRVVGQHRGIGRYTVGQRRGLGVAGGPARYVVAIDASRNAVVVGGPDDLQADGLVASDVNWVAVEGLDAPRRVEVRVRHGGQDITAEAVPGPEAGQVTVRFSRPQRAPSPGQAAVFYDGDIVLGGGTIDTVHLRAALPV
ncbi:MAG: tRNA 2-thiouridine(34) synthase MnmA [Armatimonadota bacterium]|nr:tRNA 2-thiouridine(34) synthase MnmA [Armatimonadota bacterium]MDR7400779.1 tRNA 2-thiouridine(34) synthase MnmA [Armatimonadota bacterium]MDR7403884.1 tRNA 2-thiouridine(34) synthase MnmA [Armatimonadota bacterium]MDR7436627.1 tRNA 2-thiouridine(34) synthase MnmA [Armatimonadota bacterium]MDR7472954.1 tRNA 2-thiouridine(34) synthase MnmA [Armatimonadota bacterium]